MPVIISILDFSISLSFAICSCKRSAIKLMLNATLPSSSSRSTGTRWSKSPLDIISSPCSRVLRSVTMRLVSRKKDKINKLIKTLRFTIKGILILTTYRFTKIMASEIMNIAIHEKGKLKIKPNNIFKRILFFLFNLENLIVNFIANSPYRLDIPRLSRRFLYFFA
ncbi:hypothetical protein D3C87_1016900 [compost metagenome]